MDPSEVVVEPAPVEPGPSEERRLPARIAPRGVSWSAGAVAVGLLLFSVIHFVRTPGGREPRPEAVRGTVAAGSSAPARSAPLAAEEAAARAALARDPEDLQARLDLVEVSLDKEDYMAVWAETRKVLARFPDEPRALTSQSQVWLALGQPAVAIDMLTRAVARSPLLLAAHVYLIDVRLRVGQTTEARLALVEAKRRFPAEAIRLDERFAQTQAAVEREGPMALGGTGDPHAGLRPGASGSLHGATSPHGAAGPEARFDGAAAMRSPDVRTVSSHP